MAFYDPFIINTLDKPIIIYIDEGTEKVLQQTDKAIEIHLNRIFEENNIFTTGEYFIIFLRKEENALMTDIWSMDKVNERGSGPLTDVRIYEGYIQTKTIGVGSGNTLIVLGEEEKRRRLCETSKKYLEKRATLPKDMYLGKSFIS